MKQNYLVFKKSFALLLKGMTVVALALIFSLQSASAQDTLTWTGIVDSDANNASNWDPQLAIADNILDIDSAGKFTNTPVVGGGEVTVNNLWLSPTGLITIDLDSPDDHFYISTETPNLFGTIEILKGIFSARRCEIDDSNSVVNIYSGGTFESTKYLFFGNGSSPAFGGFMNIYGTGKLIHTNTVVPDRFPSDTTQGIITLVDSGRIEIRGDWVAGAEARMAKGQLVTPSGRDLVLEYSSLDNYTYITSRPDSILVIEPKDIQNLVLGVEGGVLRLVHNRGYSLMDSVVWKYASQAGGPYASFSPNQTADTLVPVFNASGNFWVVCEGYKDGVVKETSNEVMFIVSSDQVSVSPDGIQVLKVGQEGNTLEVEELTAATSREWMYSTTSGMNYQPFTPAQTETLYTPVFDAVNTYYVICQSIIGGLEHNTGEVQIIVNDTATSATLEWTGVADTVVTNMLNWDPNAKIFANILTIDTPYVNKPVLTEAGYHNINGLNVNQGATFVIDMPGLVDTLYRGADVYVGGNLIVRSGIFHINGRLRLESGDPSVEVTGGKIIMTTDFIVGAKNGSMGARYIKISDDGLIDGGAKFWRFATDTTLSVFYISDHGKLIFHGDKREYVSGDDVGLLYAVSKGQLMSDPEDPTRQLVIYYDQANDISVATTSFCILPTSEQTVGVGQVLNLEGVNTDDVTAYQWKYATTQGGPYTAFDPAQTSDALAVSFDEAGSYYIICEATTTSFGTVTSNEVAVTVSSVEITPGDVQTIEPFETGTVLTVEVTGTADSYEWKVSATSGSGYEPFDPVEQNNTLTPMFSEEGTYYIICEVTIGESTYASSNEVQINVESETGLDESRVNAFRIYPNPAKGQFMVESEQLYDFNIKIVDLLGKVVFAREYRNTNTPLVITLEKGVYLVKISTHEGEQLIQRIVVE
ncbi:MAG: T9SS type A sorting domain-containing protein [Bacteroidales bacterium]|nr:T9SS type A sorting domain-containing protein [Bacteroidales bacterium]